jgi:hypothetical protein
MVNATPTPTLSIPRTGLGLDLAAGEEKSLNVIVDEKVPSVRRKQCLRTTTPIN